MLLPTMPDGPLRHTPRNFLGVLSEIKKIIVKNQIHLTPPKLFTWLFVVLGGVVCGGGVCWLKPP